MVQWDLGIDRDDSVQAGKQRVRRMKVNTSGQRNTSSRPLVEPEYNSHLLHTGRRSRTVNKNGRKLRIRRVVKNARPLNSHRQGNSSNSSID